MTTEHPLTSSPRRILLVDDHSAFRRAVRDFLPPAFVEVFECSSGKDAASAYREHRPDWVLMDIEMPGMDGFTATRAIFQNFPQARVVMVSQHDSAELREEARLVGAIAFVRKDELAALRTLFELPSASSATGH